MENDKLKLWLEFGKFFLGTFLIGFISMIVKLGFEDRELAIKESEQIGQYVEIALREDVGVRKRFAEYFKTVSIAREYRQRWEAYFNIVNREFISIQHEVDEFQAKIDSLSVLLKRMGKSTVNLMKRDSLREEFEHRIDILEDEKESLEEELEVEVDFWDPESERTFTAGIHSLNPDQSKKKLIRGHLLEKGYYLGEDDEHDYKQTWMAQKSTVFYYSKYTRPYAEQLAAELSQLTGEEFEIARGAELGLPENEEKTTLFIHYIGS